MPIKIQNDLPVREKLEEENLFVQDEERSIHQDIRPLQICILNLMPVKEDTELQLLRMLSNTPLQIEITFMRMGSHESTHTSISHLNQFYNTFEQLKERRFDGMIITGAPVEKMPYEEVDYWPELCAVMEWSKTNVTSTFHICWGAQAGLYYHYGLDKVMLKEKLSGVYAHKVIHRREPLVRGFDDFFLIPHSRYTEVPAAAIHAKEELKVLAESEVAGVLLCMAKEGRQMFIFGHPEYDRYTLRNEYIRDVNAGISPQVPINYFPDDDPEKEPELQWRSHSSLLYSNWLNYYVYQLTPYDLNEIR
ncbi:MAG: homoserine O-succinyltransferase [Lachnospiraceae bacterium]|nr:homoserine O-succinyltransferase [Lachnospiraceae bacterium]